MDLKATFEKYKDEYIKFERAENKMHSRPDLCAFLLLHKLVPNDGRDMVSTAYNDEIHLSTDCDSLAEAATEADILTLVRCGVRYDGGINSLVMFV